MRKSLGLLLVFSVFMVLILQLNAVASDNSLKSSIEFQSSAFEPGGVLLATFNKNLGARKATIRFLDRTYTLGRTEDGLEALAFIGLDLQMIPGLYEMEISLEGEGGEKETIREEIRLNTREFPVKKLWVKEEYVTPPPHVQERIRREAELLRIVYSITAPVWLGEGGFILPHHGKVAPNFGERRVYNNLPRSTHTGVDISAPLGDPVVASNSGKVVLASDLYFSGKTVILDHGLGVFTVYCHFSKIEVKRGEIVKKRDVVGLAGSTGRSTGPHLHWGVKIYNSRVDPLVLVDLPL